MASQFLDREKRNLSFPGLPFVSTELDSVRSYQWEFSLFIPEAFPGNSVEFSRAITLGAKQIDGFGFEYEDIEVSRMNDKVYYPGKISQQELTVTFDNLLNFKEGRLLLDYVGSVYSQRTGKSSTPDSYKTKARIREFNGAGEIQSVIDLIGAYPKSYVRGEKNYSTSEFDTIQVKFRYDFIEVYNGEVETPEGILGSVLTSTISNIAP